jgi:oligoendopeptidase F
MPEGTKNLGGYMKKKLIAQILAFAFILSLIAPSSAYAGISKDGTTYTVEKGDNLVEIAKELKLNWRDIAKKNNITKPWMLSIGQKLKIKDAIVAKAPTVTVSPTDKEEAVVHGTTAFKDITYVRPDFKAMTKTIQSISPLLKKKNQDEKIRKLSDQISEDYLEAATMKNYLFIKSSQDVTDQKVIEESSYITTNLATIDQLINKVQIEILNSSYDAIIREELTDKEIQTIYKNSKLYTSEYVTLQTKTSDLISQYQNTMVTTTVEVNGVAMNQNDIYYSTTLNDTEKKTYLTQLQQAVIQNAGAIYLDLVNVYKDTAKLAGYNNVTDYMYNAYERDYTPKQAQQFSKYVKLYIVPLYLDLLFSLTQEDRDLINSAPGSIKELEPSMIEYFGSVSDEMLEAYKYMKKLGLYNASATPVQQNIGYTIYLHSLNEPYMNIYTSGYYTDISTYIHEFGHFNAAYVNGSSLGSNMDICEIHSQGNEMLFTPYYEIYGKAYTPIVKNQVLKLLATIISGCIYDEFQQYVYSHDVTSIKELNEVLFQLDCDYGITDTSSGITQDPSWVYILHNYQLPLYYISYAMSAVPSLEIFTDSLTDREAAIDTYNEVVNSGTEFSFQELLKNTGLSSPFKKATFYNLTKALSEYFESTDEEVKPAA